MGRLNNLWRKKAFILGRGVGIKKILRIDGVRQIEREGNLPLFSFVVFESLSAAQTTKYTRCTLTYVLDQRQMK